MRWAYLIIYIYVYFGYMKEVREGLGVLLLLFLILKGDELFLDY